LLISAILLQPVIFAAGQPTDQFILPSDGQKDQAFHMVVIGDSVAWGNGLREENKYYHLVADWLQKALNKPIDVTVYAHSGATISGETGKSIDPNLNSGYPTLMDQAKSIQNADDVDLILVSGGINDVGALNIINVNEPAAEIQKSSEAIEVSMENLLTDLLNNNKKAKIIVTSYYPIVSEDTNEGFITSIVSLVAQIQGSVGEHEIILMNNLNQKSRLVENSYTFNGASLTSLTNAIKRADNDANRIGFSMVTFPSNRCYGTSESWLWALVSLTPLKTNDDQYEYRSSLTSDLVNKINAMGHPNVDGAKEYARAIESTVASKGLSWLQNSGATVRSEANTDSKTDDTLASNPSVEEFGTWNKTFGKGVLYSVQQTSDGNYIATGYRSEGDNQDVLLIKTDEAGNELLNKTFDNHSLDWGSSIQLTSDGGYIIAGGTREELEGNYITYRAWLIKTDVDGNLLWDKTFESHNGNPGLAYSVQPTTDDGYILAGHTFGEAWLIKTDSNGNELWKRKLTGSGPYYGGANCWAKSVLPTSDGGYILAGESPFTNDVILIKTNGNGEKIWDKTSDRTFGGYGLAGAFSIRPTSEGGYIIAGKTGGTWFSNSRRDIHMSPDDTFSAYGACGYAWLIKTDADGNMIWNKTYSTSYENHSGAYSVQLINDGGYIIAGMTGLGFNEYYDAWLIKTDSEGDMLWNRTFGCSSFDEAYSVQQTRDGGYIIAGTTAGNTWLIKTDAEGLETVPQQPKSSEAQSLSRSDQNTPTHEEAPEDNPANAKESPLPISIGAISLIAAVLSMKSRRDRL
jgi:lysophospholipase L1-like esterase